MWAHGVLANEIMELWVFLRVAQQNPWEDEHQRDEAQRAQAFGGWSSQVGTSSIERQQQVVDAIVVNSANVAKHSVLSEMVIDSGASKHMVAGKDINIMQELLPASGTVTVADGHTTRPTARGTAAAPVAQNCVADGVSLGMIDATLMEDFPDTLYSIPAAVMRQGCRIVFDRIESYIELPSGIRVPVEYSDSKRQWTVRVAVRSVGIGLGRSTPHPPLNAPTEKQVERARRTKAKRMAGVRGRKRVQREGRMQHNRLQHRRTMHGYDSRALSKLG